MLNVIMIDLEMFKEDTRENLIRFRNFMDGLGICRPQLDQIHHYCPFTNTSSVEEDNGINFYVGDGITAFSPYSGHIDDPYIEHIWALRWGWVWDIDNERSYPNIYKMGGREGVRKEMTLEFRKKLMNELDYSLQPADHKIRNYCWGRGVENPGKYFKKIWIQPQTGFIVAYEWQIRGSSKKSEYVVTDQYTAYLLSLPAVKVPEIEEEQELSFERGDLDKVLDKISAKGIESLTQREKDFLQACTKGFFGKLF